MLHQCNIGQLKDVADSVMVNICDCWFSSQVVNVNGEGLQNVDC